LDGKNTAKRAKKYPPIKIQEYLLRIEKGCSIHSLVRFMMGTICTDEPKCSAAFFNQGKAAHIKKCLRIFKGNRTLLLLTILQIFATCSVIESRHFKPGTSTRLAVSRSGHSSQTVQGKSIVSSQNVISQAMYIHCGAFAIDTRLFVRIGCGSTSSTSEFRVGGRVECRGGQEMRHAVDIPLSPEIHSDRMAVQRLYRPPKLTRSIEPN
jgi:hypothetical protein